MNQYDLGGEVAIVTGGAQGIGFACAKRFVQSGAKIALWDIDVDQLHAAKSELGNDVTTAVVDITQLAQVEEATAALNETHGKVSILLNSAGIAGINTTVEKYPVDEWQRIMDLNVNGTFYINRTVVPYMKQNGYGRIVNIASVAGKAKKVILMHLPIPLPKRR